MLLMSQFEPSQTLARLGSAQLGSKISQSGSFANFFKKTSKYNNSANFNPNLIKLPPFDSAHQVESNGGNFIKFGLKLTELLHFEVFDNSR